MSRRVSWKWSLPGLVIVALLSWMADHLLATVSRYAEWLLLVFGVCWLAMLFLALAALVRRRWRELAIFSLASVLFALPGLGLTKPTRWLQAAGFRIYASPIDDYLSRCSLFNFVDVDGTEQQIGQCHSVPLSFDSHLTVIYDTTGQFTLPVERRTSAWQSAVSWHLSAGGFLARNNYGPGRSHIFGNFYSVLIPSTEEDGNDGK